MAGALAALVGLPLAGAWHAGEVAWIGASCQGAITHNPADGSALLAMTYQAGVPCWVDCPYVSDVFPPGSCSWATPQHLACSGSDPFQPTVNHTLDVWEGEGPYGHCDCWSWTDGGDQGGGFLQPIA